MRVRGLKHRKGCCATTCGNVAPHAGAWIETSCKSNRWERECVAPHAGAWIET